jgi:hypothetical protein
MSYLRCDNKINKMISERKKKKRDYGISTTDYATCKILYIKINMTGFHYLAILIVGCSFKFILKVVVEESIVSLQSKNTNNAKSEVRFKPLIRDL